MWESQQNHYCNFVYIALFAWFVTSQYLTRSIKKTEYLFHEKVARKICQIADNDIILKNTFFLHLFFREMAI